MELNSWIVDNMLRKKKEGDFSKEKKTRGSATSDTC